MRNYKIENPLIHSQKGFTLIEVVVTAVIVGILSLFAIQLYTGYIEDTKQQTVNNLAQTAATAANAYHRKTGTHPDSAALNLFLPEANRFTIQINSGNNPPNIVITDTKGGGNVVSKPANY